MDSSGLGRALPLDHGGPASAALPCWGKVWNLGPPSVPFLLVVDLKWQSHMYDINSTGLWSFLLFCCDPPYTLYSILYPQELAKNHHIQNHHLPSLPPPQHQGCFHVHTLAGHNPFRQHHRAVHTHNASSYIHQWHQLDVLISLPSCTGDSHLLPLTASLC